MSRHLAIAVLAALLSLVRPSSVASQAGNGYGRGQPLPRVDIAGRVVDRAGKPVSDVFVTAVWPEPLTNGRFYPWAGNIRLFDITNAQGTYELNGVSAGEHYVIAMPHNPVYASPGKLNTFGNGNTFYPSAARVTEAKRVVIRPGGPPVIANITLRPAPLAMISGVVIGSNGRPVPGGKLGIAHGDGFFGFDGRGLTFRPNGRFTAPALAPGTYILSYRESAWPPPRGVIPTISGARVTVSGKDIADVRVAPIHMVRGTGRIIAPASVLAALTPDKISMGARGPDCCPGPTPPAIVRGDGTFELKAWPGDARIFVTLRVPRLAVRAIRHKGADVTNTLIAFVEGNDVTGLEIEIGPPAAPPSNAPR